MDGIDAMKGVTLRTELRGGDCGMLVHMHGRIYAEEYGYSTVFEGYVAASFAEFLLREDMSRDRVWLAERGGKIIGSIAILARGERAQLRWFLLEREARGIGLGRRLLEAALDFCRQQGFSSVYLETTDDLKRAVSMYEGAGFVLRSKQRDNAWSVELSHLEYELEL